MTPKIEEGRTYTSKQLSIAGFENSGQTFGFTAIIYQNGEKKIIVTPAENNYTINFISRKS